MGDIEVMATLIPRPHRAGEVLSTPCGLGNEARGCDIVSLSKTESWDGEPGYDRGYQWTVRLTDADYLLGTT